MITAYERACEAIREANRGLLAEFVDWLGGQCLSEATIRSHRGNIDLYINHFLLEEQIRSAATGAHGVSMYLGSWYLRKVRASAWMIKSNAASLRKFYTFMVERGSTGPDSLAYLNARIKAGMSDWLATVERYNAAAVIDPGQVWGR